MSLLLDVEVGNGVSVQIPELLPTELILPEGVEASTRHNRLFVAGMHKRDFLPLRDRALALQGRTERPRENDLVLKVEYNGLCPSQITSGLAYFVNHAGELESVWSGQEDSVGGLLVDSRGNESLPDFLKRIVKERNLDPQIYVHESLGGQPFGFVQAPRDASHPYLRPARAA